MNNTNSILQLINLQCQDLVNNVITYLKTNSVSLKKTFIKKKCFGLVGDTVETTEICKCNQCFF